MFPYSAPRKHLWCRKGSNGWKHKQDKDLEFLTFGQQKTSNERYHSNQPPILKFSPSNYLHFLLIFSSVNINRFRAIKPFIQLYPNFTMSAILVFCP